MRVGDEPYESLRGIKFILVLLKLNIIYIYDIFVGDKNWE